MRSLWSGVSGLRVHQIGMDVEGNNIANVNTYGFKYSRVNYSTMFSQTMSAATQATSTTGGKNAKQVGLGVSAASTQRIHSQGSISGTDSNYDVAIQGNGFFLVSNDGGKTKYLTRDGAFTQDAAGNFVNSNGYIVQGWVRDSVTGNIDTALSAGNISWDPAMNLPANPSSQVFLNASLNSGNTITQQTSRYLYSLDSVHNYRLVSGDTNENANKASEFYTTSNDAIDVTEKAVDFASVFSGSTYEGLNLRNGQSFWMSYADSVYTTAQTGRNDTLFNNSNTAAQNGVIFWGNSDQATTLDITLNGVNIQSSTIRGIDQAITLINSYTTSDGTQTGTGVTAQASSDGKSIVFTNTNANSGDGDEMKNIYLTINQANSAGEQWNASAVQNNARTYTQVAKANAQATAWTTGNNAGDETISVITAHRYQYSSSSIEIGDMVNPDGGPGLVTTADPNNLISDAGTRNYLTALNGGLYNSDVRIFHSTEDLRELMQRDARYGVDYNGDGDFSLSEDLNEKVTVTINSTGNYVISNANSNTSLANALTAVQALQQAGVAGGTTDGALVTALATSLQGLTNIAAKGMSFQSSIYKSETAQISSNTKLTNLFKSLDGVLDVGGGTKMSTSMVLSSFSTSLEVYDSLGTKHLIRVEWSKHETTVDGGNEWQMILRIDEPATFNVTGATRNNIIVGSVRFGNDGSLTSYEPQTITFSGNNGSAPNQRITINLGASGGYNGLVSNDQTSALSQQETDGYEPGTLKQGMQNTTIDSEGNIIGSFTNGITMILAKIAMGTVTNEAGLEDVGDNLYRMTNNSGSLTVGAPSVGGRGSFQSGALELSNTDLSLALTNLIVIQRGYQANSKTITTSDTMLNTLLQLKQ